jgi:hypothetical protein
LGDFKGVMIRYIWKQISIFIFFLGCLPVMAGPVTSSPEINISKLLRTGFFVDDLITARPILAQGGANVILGGRFVTGLDKNKIPELSSVQFTPIILSDSVGMALCSFEYTGKSLDLKKKWGLLFGDSNRQQSETKIGELTLPFKPFFFLGHWDKYLFEGNVYESLYFDQVSVSDKKSDENAQIFPILAGGLKKSFDKYNTLRIFSSGVFAHIEKPWNERINIQVEVSTQWRYIPITLGGIWHSKNPLAFDHHIYRARGYGSMEYLIENSIPLICRFESVMNRIPRKDKGAEWKHHVTYLEASLPFTCPWINLPSLGAIGYSCSENILRGELHCALKLNLTKYSKLKIGLHWSLPKYQNSQQSTQNSKRSSRKSTNTIRVSNEEHKVNTTPKFMMQLEYPF